jgi:hypothetical protein
MESRRALLRARTIARDARVSFATDGGWGATLSLLSPETEARSAG